MRLLISLAILSVFFSASFAAVTEEAAGYMTRYEMARLLSEFSDGSGKLSDIEKVLAELRAEAASLKYKEENPGSPVLSGDYTQRILLGNPTTPGPRGPRFDYRIRLSLYEKIGQSASFRASLDTVDSGFGGRSRDLLTKLIDVEGRVKAGSVNLYAKAGPGTIARRELDGINPSEDYMIYIRPKTSFGTQTYWQNLDLSLEYVTRKVDTLGRPGVNEVTGRIARALGGVPLLNRAIISFRPRHLWSASAHDNIAELNVKAYPSPILSLDATLGAGHTQSPSGLYARAEAKVETQRTRVTLTGYKVGSSYRTPLDKYEFIPLNEFNKLVLDGTTDVAFTLSHMVSDRLSAAFRSALSADHAFRAGKEHPGTSLTTEYSLSVVLSPSSHLKGFYRSYAVPSGISSPDPTMAVAVPELSDIFGLEVKIKI